MSIEQFNKILSEDMGDLIKGVSISGNTIIYTKVDGTSEEITLPTGDSIPVGSIIAYSVNSDLNGYLLCNGSAVSRTTYAGLFDAVGTLYGEGDGSTTFNLPNLTDRVMWGSGTAGSVLEAGLPDITGSFGYSVAGWGGSGAFSQYGASRSGNGSSGGYTSTDFYASRCSSIYGNSTTVQPPALTMRFYIKY